ncbi:hypothetical protein SBADM41S_06237 [Streptomyces badius]
MSLVLYSFTIFMLIATQYAVNDYAGYLERAPIALVLVVFLADRNCSPCSRCSERWRWRP